MKIRGNLVGTNQKPEKVVVMATDLTPEQQAKARENIGAAAECAGVLNVTTDFDTMKASHTSKEIYDHIQNGGTVFCDGIVIGESYEELAVCYAVAHFQENDELVSGTAMQLTIDKNGTVVWVQSFIGLLDDDKTAPGYTWSSQKIATEIGSIETALDSIIAIQNSLMGGGSV